MSLFEGKLINSRFGRVLSSAVLTLGLDNSFGGLSCAWQKVQQHPWSLLTRCQQQPYPIPQVVTKKSLHTFPSVLGGKITPGKIQNKHKRERYIHIYICKKPVCKKPVVEIKWILKNTPKEGRKRGYKYKKQQMRQTKQ